MLDLSGVGEGGLIPLWCLSVSTPKVCIYPRKNSPNMSKIHCWPPLVFPQIEYCSWIVLDLWENKRESAMYFWLIWTIFRGRQYIFGGVEMYQRGLTPLPRRIEHSSWMQFQGFICAPICGIVLIETNVGVNPVCYMCWPAGARDFQLFLSSNLIDTRPT